MLHQGEEGTGILSMIYCSMPLNQKAVSFAPWGQMDSLRSKLKDWLPQEGFFRFILGIELAFLSYSCWSVLIIALVGCKPQCLLIVASIWKSCNIYPALKLQRCKHALPAFSLLGLLDMYFQCLAKKDPTCSGRGTWMMVVHSEKTVLQAFCPLWSYFVQIYVIIWSAYIIKIPHLCTK